MCIQDYQILPKTFNSINDHKRVNETKHSTLLTITYETKRLLPMLCGHQSRQAFVFTSHSQLSSVLFHWYTNCTWAMMQVCVCRGEGAAGELACCLARLPI